MRKTTLLAALSMSAALFFTACQKEQTKTVENTTVQPAASGFRSTLEPCTEFDEADFLLNPNDAEDQNVNYALYYMTYAYRQVEAQHPTAITALKTAVQNSPAKEVDLYAFADNNPSITATINSAVAAIAEQSSVNFKYKTFLNPKLVHTQIQYKPFIVVPNAATADFGLPIYWAVGAQIDENIHPTKEDHIPVFYLDELGNCNFTALGEAEAMALANPLFIVTNGDLTVLSGVTPRSNFDVREEEQKSGFRVLAPTFEQNLFLINQAYENSGRIDYAVIGLVRYATSNDGWLIDQGYRMNRNSLGLPMGVTFALVNHSAMRPFGQYNIMARQFCDAVIASFEYDWYARGKDFGRLCLLGGSGNGLEPLNGRSKYADEWYHFNPTTNNGFNLNAFNANLVMQTYTTSKGYMRIQRLDRDL